MDKNPKHPLKKRKVQQKVNLTAENGEEEHTSGKHKKHYEQRIEVVLRAGF